MKSIIWTKSKFYWAIWKKEGLNAKVWMNFSGIQIVNIKDQSNSNDVDCLLNDDHLKKSWLTKTRGR